MPLTNDETSNGIKIKITKCIANQLAMYEYNQHFKNNDNIPYDKKEKIKKILKKSWEKEINKEIYFDEIIVEKIDIRC